MKNYIQACLLAALLVGGCAERKTEKAVAAKSIPVQMAVDKLIHKKAVYFEHGWGAGIAKKDNYIYLTKDEGHTVLAVIDVATPEKPRAVCYMEDIATNRRLFNPFIDNKMLVCQDPAGNWVPYDISDPNNPKKLLEQKPQGVIPRKMDSWTMGDGYLYYGANCTERRLLNACIFQVYKIEKTFEPKLASSLDLTPWLSESARKGIEERKKSLTDNIWTSGWWGDSIGKWHPGNIIREGTLLHVPFQLAIFGIDVADPRNPKMVYKYENGEQIRCLAKKGDLLYVASAKLDAHGYNYNISTEKGLTIIDISDRNNVRKIGEYRDLECPQYMLLQDNTLYLVGTEYIPEEERCFKDAKIGYPQQKMLLHVLDVSNPGKVKRIGTYRFQDRNGWYSYCCQGLIFERGLLYVGDPATGLRILDVRSPSEIKEISVLPQQGEAAHIVLAGDYAYIDNHSGFTYNMYSVDIREPEKATLANYGPFIPGSTMTGRHWFTPGSTRDFGQYMYLLRGDKFICVLDLENPAVPVVDHYVSLPEGWGAHNPSGGLINRPDSLLLVAYRNPRQYGLIVYKKDAGGKELVLKKELVIPGISNSGSIQGIVPYCIQGEKVYILTLEEADNKDLPDATLTVVDIKNTDEPAVIATKRLHKGLRPGKYIYYGMLCDGRYLYILGEPSTTKPIADHRPKALYIYDVSNPDEPILVSTLEEQTSESNFKDMTRLGNYPTLVLQEYGLGISLVDISDPKAPEVIWREPTPELKWKNRYPKCGFSAGEYRNGYLYIPRLDRLDVYEAHLAKKTTLQERIARIDNLLKTDHASAISDPTTRGAITACAKNIEYYRGASDWLSAKEWADEMEHLLQGAARFPDAEMTAPKAKGPVVIDGSDAEWKDIPSFVFPGEKAQVRLQWDDKFLYFLFEVNDPTVEKSGGIWDSDGAEIYLNTSLRKGQRLYSPTDYQYVASISGKMYINGNNPRFISNSKPPESKACSQSTKTGYLLEIALAHAETWITPQAGVQIAWMAIVNDRKGSSPQLKYTGDTTFFRFVGAAWPHMRFGEALP